MEKHIFLLVLLFIGSLSLYSQEVYDSSQVHEIRIQFAADNWAEQLATLKEEGEDRLLGDVVIDGVDYKDCGIRYKGNSSYNFIRQTKSSKLPFNIKLNYVDKEQKLPDGNKTLKVANGFRDPSFIREVLGYDIARQYMPASRASYVHLYVNDSYLGLYTLIESVDNPLLDHYFGEHDGVLFKCDPNYSIKAPEGCPEGDRASLMHLGPDSTCYMGYYELKSDHGWSEMIKLTQTLNEDLDNIEDILDVDQVLWMLAFDNYTVNLDSYLGAFSHNYFLYQDREGIFHPIIWDLNLAFGGFRLPSTKKSYSDEELKKMSMFLHFKENNTQRPLITYLLRKELYRKVYLAHIKTILEDQALDSLLYKRGSELKTFLRDEVQKDTNKFYSDEMFEASLDKTQGASKEYIIGLFDLMNGRHKYLNEHIVLRREPPAIQLVEHKKNGEMLTISADIGNALGAWLCHRTDEGLSFKRVAMKKGNANEAEGEMIRWTANIDFQEGLQYYVIAEGQYNATLSPRKASFEFYTVD